MKEIGKYCVRGGGVGRGLFAALDVGRWPGNGKSGTPQR